MKARFLIEMYDPDSEEDQLLEVSRSEGNEIASEIEALVAEDYLMSVKFIGDKKLSRK